MLYNLIAVFDPARECVLMCRRRKPPFAGLLNFVGGKIEPGEDHAQAAYRELREETGITDMPLVHLMDLAYPLEGFSMEVYAGALEQQRDVRGEENALCWVRLSEDFTDESRFAGRGNLDHIVRYWRAQKI